MKHLIILISLIQLSIGQDFTIHLKKGEIFDIVAAGPKSAEAFQNARKEYFPKVFPLAQKHGFKSLGNLYNTEAGKEKHFNPSAFAFFTWPSMKHLISFDKEESWPLIKSTRPKYYTHLRVNHFPVKEDMSITFKKGKSYSVLYMWNYGFVTDTKNFYSYIKHVNPILEHHGGKVIASFTGGTFEALNNDRKPDRITIIEWPDKQSSISYTKSPERNKYDDLFKRVVAESEVFHTFVR